MKATVNNAVTSKIVKDAVAVFEDLNLFLEAEWENIVRRIAKEQLAKAWFPWTKKYWQVRLAGDTIVETNGTYYNSPMYHYWGQKRLTDAQNLQRRFRCAKNELQSTQIVLNDDEIDLLSYAVEAAKQIMQRTKGV